MTKIAGKLILPSIVLVIALATAAGALLIMFSRQIKRRMVGIK